MEPIRIDNIEKSFLLSNITFIRLMKKSLSVSKYLIFNNIYVYYQYIG